MKRLNKWRDVPCSCTERLNIIKMSVLCNLICQFMKSKSKPQEDILCILIKFKFISTDETPRRANTILKNKAGGLTLSSILYKTIVIKAVYW